MVVEMRCHLDSKKGSLVERLIDGIRCGMYPAGTKLPSEREIAEYYNCSRTVVRKALEELFLRQIMLRGGRKVQVSEDALRLIEDDFTAASQRVILIITPSQVNNPIIQNIFTTIDGHLPEGVCLSVMCFNRYSRAGVECLAPTDLVLVIGPQYDDLLLESIERRCAGLLLINMPNPRFNYVTPDHYAGGRMMAELLWKNNHTSIGAIYPSNSERIEFGQRFNGARDFLNEHGIVIKTFPADLQASADEISVYQQSFEYLYKMDPTITAVICVWDRVAFALYELFMMMNIHIPDDISLIGFDDQFFSHMLNPPLTTVRYPAEIIGQEVAGAIRGFVDNGKIEIQKVVLPTLQQRGSVAVK